jgi:hypothetical protein
MTEWSTRLTRYLVSVPERVLRSATALAGGLIRELGDVAVPARVRRTILYQSMVESTLRFLIEQVGQVEGAYPDAGRLAQDFAIRRGVGNGIELAGILAFRASPVWVLAALADISGAGRELIQEIAGSLKEEGLLEPEAQFSTVDQLLDGLERSSGRLAETINTPPLNVAELRSELSALRADASRIPSPSLPSPELLNRTWLALKQSAASEGRSVFEMSSLVALTAVARLPENLLWLSRCARSAARKTGELLASGLLDYYTTTLVDIHRTGYLEYCSREFRPYLRAAAAQFSPRRLSLTEKLLRDR